MGRIAFLENPKASLDGSNLDLEIRSRILISQRRDSGHIKFIAVKTRLSPRDEIAKALLIGLALAEPKRDFAADRVPRIDNDFFMALLVQGNFELNIRILERQITGAFVCRRFQRTWIQLFHIAKALFYLRCELPEP